MNTFAVVRRILAWIVLPLGLAALAILSTIPRLVPVLWTQHSFIWMLAPVLLVFAAILGILFRQVRVSLMAVVVGTLVLRLRIDTPAAGHDLVLAYLAGPLVPLAATIFLLIPEQRLFTEWGITRVCLACFFAGMLYMVPQLTHVQAWFIEHPIPSLLPVVHVSVPAVLALGALLVAALSVRRHEAPNIGLFFVALALHVLFLGSADALAQALARPAPALQEAFAISAALLLAWLSIDCGWRNAFMDELTQLPGRRPMRHHFASLGQTFTLASADIDHFKKINDRYGHDVGDQVLRLIAAQLRAFRAGTAYRFGGEEFALVMKRGEPAEQVAHLDALREQIAARPFVLRSRSRPRKKPSPKSSRPPANQRNTIHVTVSIGVAATEEGDDPDEVLTAADQALYKAKKGGRNRVCVAKSIEPS